jgi:UDP-N-acetylmuramate--alanine ligase
MTSTHFIGIGGTGLSAIARVLLERGEHVTGSDREESPLAVALREAGVHVAIGHAAANVNGATRVVRSSAIPDDNVEVQAAVAKGIPVMKRAEFLGELLAGQQVIAVAGSHGKTTTTAMLAWLLSRIGQQPGYIIGSVAENLGSNAAAGAGKLFVIEADEYDYMFLGLQPSIAVITNVEHDHPDLFPNEEDFYQAFRDFADRLHPDGVLLACADNPGAAAIQSYAAEQGGGTRSYALHAPADYQAANLASLPGRGFAFNMLSDGEQIARVELSVPGEHNAQNALAALAVIHLLGFPLDAADLAEFRGTQRRFELRGETAGILVIDDYAHHPTEIRATLAAARARYPQRRLWALWQPHTYSRTNALWPDFAAAFADADQVLVTSVYAAREEPPQGFDMADLVDSIAHPAAQYADGLAAAQQILLRELNPEDVLLVLSAGDAVELSASLFARLQEKED